VARSGSKEIKNRGDVDRFGKRETHICETLGSEPAVGLELERGREGVCQDPGNNRKSGKVIQRKIKKCNSINFYWEKTRGAAFGKRNRQ